MNYCFQEGSISLPTEEYQDNSVNLLRFPSLQGSISLTRDRLAAHINTADYLAGQLAAIQKEMKNAVVKQPDAFTTDKGLSGNEIYCETKQKGVNIYQWIAAFDLQSQILVLTYSQIKPFSNAERLQWIALRDSFIPNQ